MRKSPTINRLQKCKRCNIEFTPKGNRVFYCPTCRPIVERERKMKWYVKNNPNAYAPKINRVCFACGERAVCSIDGVWYCNKHYLKMYFYGTLDSGRKSKNTVSIIGDIVELKTTKGETILIDATDLEQVNKYTWCVSKTGYAVANINHKVTKLHRYILSPSENQIVDHINGNKLDNRRCNLRLCDNASNVRNSKLQTNNKTGYPGIRLTESSTYNVRITVNRKEIHVGNFKTLEEAIEARIKAEREYYGEFAPSLGSLKEHISTSTLGESE